MNVGKIELKLRRGIRTVEVQAPVVASVGMWLASAAHVLPPRYAVYVTMASSACIAVSRGLAKLSDPRLNLQEVRVTPEQATPVQPTAAQNVVAPS